MFKGIMKEGEKVLAEVIDEKPEYVLDGLEVAFRAQYQKDPLYLRKEALEEWSAIGGKLEALVGFNDNKPIFFEVEEV